MSRDLTSLTKEEIKTFKDNFDETQFCLRVLHKIAQTNVNKTAVQQALSMATEVFEDCDKILNPSKEEKQRNEIVLATKMFDEAQRKTNSCRSICTRAEETDKVNSTANTKAELKIAQKNLVQAVKELKTASTKYKKAIKK